MRYFLAILLPLPLCWAASPAGQSPAPIDPEPCVVYQFDSIMRFGVIVRRDHHGTANPHADFRKREEIPDFIQALEKPDLKEPGTVAHLTLKVGGLVEPPGRVSLTHWRALDKWEIPVENIGGDSAVVLYWEPR